MSPGFGQGEGEGERCFAGGFARLFASLVWDQRPLARASFLPVGFRSFRRNELLFTAGESNHYSRGLRLHPS